MPYKDSTKPKPNTPIKSKHKPFFKKKSPEFSWQDEWKDMPEYVQEDLTSYRKIIIHFRNDADVEEFSKLIGQKISPKQTSLWHPKLEFRIASKTRYVDES